MGEPVVIERVIDLPREIVEDAFTDPDLAEGWFHPTQLPDPDSGIDLREVSGGTRGFSTVVRLTVQPDSRAHDDSVAEWEHRLDLLENLLRGHPVDWSTEAGGAQGMPNSAAQ